MVAVGWASNATGTINPVRRIVKQAHAVGALVFVDAVHLAPHRRINLGDVGCDFLACSAYKFFGPHVGILWGRRRLLESLQPDKLRPAPNELPGKWMTGTQNHEGIAGVQAAVDYLANLSRESGHLSRRERLDHAFQHITAHEEDLSRHVIAELRGLSDFRIWGITDPGRISERVPTFSLTHSTLSPRTMGKKLSEAGIFAWAGNHYAQPFTEAAGLEREGTLRIGLLHYNTHEEIDRLVSILSGFQ